jgi:isoleucyl-tRNA synthetase
VSEGSSDGKRPGFVLGQHFEPREIEKAVREFWASVDVRRQIAQARRGAVVLGFVEGPPTLNGEPHIGHVRGRIFKDLWYRRETMGGNFVLFRSGWDTQGLPVELQAEKELGLKGNKTENLKAIGEEKLVAACKEIVKKYGKSWLAADSYVGLLLDYDGYWTYRDQYIEREWKILEAAYGRGLLGEGQRVVAYCPSCQTSLSNREVADGYETVTDPSLYYKAKAGEGLYLVVWTTMPFTVVTDELIGVNPETDYSYVKVGGETWIVGDARVDDVLASSKIEGATRLKTVKGSALEGLRYEPPLRDIVPGQARLAAEGKVHMVVAEDFVDPTTGSGVVHMAPANGEEDFEVASRRKLPIFNPIDDEVKFTEDAGGFAGSFVRDTDEAVVTALRERGLVVSYSKIRHEYPTCWRSHHKLVYMLRREYFYWVDRIVEKTVEAAEKVEYFYEGPKNRFLEIIKEARPWNITRERIWGAPLPLWACGACGEKTALFSRKAILEAAVELPDGPEFELHRPWIDRVVVRCRKCGGRAYREPFVLDTWHNSGAAPYAGQSDGEYSSLVPVPFLTEGIDQTRGWAYTLLVENVILSGKAQAPYKSFLFQGHVLDEKGEKMSKSKGNTLEASKLFPEHSADLVRFYLLWKGTPIDSVNFDAKEMYGRPFQVLNTLYHLHLYYQTNSRYDGFVWDASALEGIRERGGLEPQDCWLLSKLEGLVAVADEAYRGRRFNEATRAFDSFIIEVLSQEYVPLTRGELWDDLPETKGRRDVIYAVLAQALRTLDLLLHPYVPFLTDFLFNAVFSDGGRSVILERTPEADGALVDAALEEEYDRMWALVSLANSARMNAKVKRRWPLGRGLYSADTRLSGAAEKLLAEVANVRTMEFKPAKELPLKLKARLDTAVAGRRLKQDFNSVVSAVNAADPWSLWAEAREKGHVSISVGDRLHTFDRKELQFEVSPETGYAVGSLGDNFVALDSTRDEKLIAEGVVRDVARRLQALRKERGCVPTDVLPVAALRGLDRATVELLAKKKEELLFLVRVKEVDISEEAPQGDGWSESDLDGKKIFLRI